MAKPEPVTQVATPFNTEASPKEAAEITVQTGDVLVAFAISEDSTAAIGVSGGGLAWTQRKVFSTANNVFESLWTASATEAKSFKVKFTRESGSGSRHFGGAVQVWRKSSGIGAVAGSTNTEGAPSLAITTEKSNSAIAMCVGDWNAKTGAATYRTGAGAFVEKNHVEDSGRYTMYGGYHADAGAAGAYTVGMTAPTGQKYSIAAVEIKGEEGGGKTVEGSAKGTATFSGLAGGLRSRLGRATGAASFTGAAGGLRARLGQALGAASFSGASGGLRTRLGAAQGAAKFSGSAGGQVVPKEAATVEGQARGTAKFSGAAGGVRARLGRAAGAAVFAGIAGGLRSRLGKAAGVAAFSGLAGGQVVKAPGSFTGVLITREHPPSKLAVRIEAEDGTPLGRWAEDEAKVENVLGSFTKDGDMPGGHKDSGCVLARDPKQSHPDLALFSKYKVEGAGGEVLWQGTLRQQPQSDGYHIAIEPKAVGDRQFLEDDEGAVGPGFINRDLSAWTGPSVARRIELDKVNAPNQTDPQVITNPNGLPALQLEVSGAWVAPVTPRCEAFFTALNGTTIGRLLGVFEAPGANANWMLDTWVGGEHVGDIYAGAGGAIDYTPTAPQSQVSFTWTYTATPEGADGYRWPLRLSSLIVLGPQGLALKGAWPNIGFTAKQMIPYIAALGGLATKDELLEDDGFVIPQAWFDAPTTPMSKLVEVTKYGLLDHFVFNDRLLQYRVPGAYGRKWRLDAGSAPKNSGPDAERVWDRLRVTWQDVDRTQKSAVVGPITDPRNPAVAAGRPRRKLLALNGVCTEGLAVQTATRFLEEAQQLDQSGSATLTGYVQEHSSGVWYPAAYVQPGDWVVEPATGLERKITSAPYGHDSKSVAVTLGGPPDGLAALEERFNGRLIELGL